MKKIDPTVLKESAYISVWVIILSVLMQGVFLIIWKDSWSLDFLWGNILSAGVGILNFFLMGLSVQKALDKDEKDAKTAMRLSQVYRTLLLFVALVVGIVLPVFNNWAVVIPIFFPRIAIMFRPVFDKNKES